MPRKVNTHKINLDSFDLETSCGCGGKSTSTSSSSSSSFFDDSSSNSSTSSTSTDVCTFTKSTSDCPKPPKPKPKPDCETEKICFTIKHGKHGCDGKQGPKGDKGDKGPKGCDGNHGCDGKNLANNIAFNGCAVYVLNENHIKVLNKNTGKQTCKSIQLPKHFLYEGVTAVNGDIWITAKKEHDSGKCDEDVYLIIYHVESGKFERPTKI